jgi:YesN/AraC family two-component response regulator
MRREGIVVGESTPEAGRQTVVCIDDDPELLRSLKRALRSEPYDLFLTHQPRQVFAWIRERPVDLVLADQRMPEMDGISLLKVVQERSPATSCVMMSGYPDTALLVADSGIDVKELILKPWDSEALKNTVRRVLEGRSAQSTRSDATVQGQIRVDCASKCTREVMAEVLNACEPIRRMGRSPILDLRNAHLLTDSLMRLLKSLARASDWFDLEMDVRDSSGYADAFREVLRQARANA